MCIHSYTHLFIYAFIYTYIYMYAHSICIYICIQCIRAYIYDQYMAVDQIPFCRGAPPSVTNLCRGPCVTNPCRGPLCRVLLSSRSLSRWGLLQNTPRLLQTFVAKWPPKPVTRPMFLIRCHICAQIYPFMSRTIIGLGQGSLGVRAAGPWQRPGSPGTLAFQSVLCKACIGPRCDGW